MKAILITISWLIMLSGCSEQSNAQIKTTFNEKTTSGNGIVAGEIESLLITKFDRIEFVIKNQTEFEQTITFPSSKLFEYEIFDENHNQIESNQGMVYTQAIKNIHLVQGEEYILGTIHTKHFDPGIYKIKVWSTPLNHIPFQKCTILTKL